MTEIKKQYDLEERTLKFAKNTRLFIGLLPKTVAVIEDSKQVVRSSGSVGANYIEANESLSQKDFLHRIKICRKEAKETMCWLELLAPACASVMEEKRLVLLQEAKEFMMIFGSIIKKVQ